MDAALKNVCTVSLGITYTRHVKHAARGPHAALCKHTCGPHKGSTYVREQLFSFMKSTKTSQRTRVTDQHLSSLIKVGTAQTFQPDIPKTVIEKRCQASGQNTKND